MSIRIKVDISDCIDLSDQKRRRSLLLIDISSMRFVDDVKSVIMKQLKIICEDSDAIYLSIDGYTIASNEFIRIIRDGDCVLVNKDVNPEKHTPAEHFQLVSETNSRTKSRKLKRRRCVKVTSNSSKMYTSMDLSCIQCTVLSISHGNDKERQNGELIVSKHSAVLEEALERHARVVMAMSSVRESGSQGGCSSGIGHKTFFSWSDMHQVSLVNRGVSGPAPAARDRMIASVENDEPSMLVQSSDDISASDGRAINCFPSHGNGNDEKAGKDLLSKYDGLDYDGTIKVISLPQLDPPDLNDVRYDEPDGYDCMCELLQDIYKRRKLLE